MVRRYPPFSIPALVMGLTRMLSSTVILEQAWISVSLYDGDHDERLTEDVPSCPFVICFLLFASV